MKPKVSTIKTALKAAGTFLDKNSPTVLTGIAIVGIIGVIVLTKKAAVKADHILANEEERREKSGEPAMTTGEKIAKTWTCYIPVAIVSGVAIGCAIGANTINGRRNAVLASALVASTDALAKHKDKVEELLGKRKAKEIEEALSQDKVNVLRPRKLDSIPQVGTGQTLCLDALTGQYFRSCAEEIHRRINSVNEELLTNGSGYISMSDYLYLMGLNETQMSDEFGWNIEHGMVKITFDSAVMGGTDEPVLVVRHLDTPRYRHYF